MNSETLIKFWTLILSVIQEMWSIAEPRIEDAAHKSLADTVIDPLPKQYEQLLGRRFAGGVDLSGGQWQKVALARAYMRDAQLISDRYAQEEILKIDQPDKMTEEIYQEQFAKMYAQQQLQAQAQQMQTQGQSQQGQPGMEQIPPEMMQQGGPMGKKMPPEMGGAMPVEAPADAMGTPMGPGGMPEDEAAMMGGM